MRTDAFWLAVGLALFSAGCSDDETSGVEPTFSNVRADVFAVSCSFKACHSGSAPSAGLNLETGAHANIVNVSAQDVPTEILVVPGDVEASYLFTKLTSDTPAAGDRMPVGTPLDDERTDLVRRWIEAGAPDN